MGVWCRWNLRSVRAVTISESQSRKNGEAAAALPLLSLDLCRSGIRRLPFTALANPFCFRESSSSWMPARSQVAVFGWVQTHAES